MTFTAGQEITTVKGEKFTIVRIGPTWNRPFAELLYVKDASGREFVIDPKEVAE